MMVRMACSKVSIGADRFLELDNSDDDKYKVYLTFVIPGLGMENEASYIVERTELIDALNMLETRSYRETEKAERESIYDQEVSE